MKDYKDSNGGGQFGDWPVIVAFGNALLDLSVEISDDSILHSFGLKDDDQGEIPANKLEKIISEAKKRYGVLQCNAGGSSLNTIKILNKVGERNALFCGSIGNDQNGLTLRSIYEQNGLKTSLQVLETYPTGTCICLINGTHRSLYANIGAALHFQKDQLNLTLPTSDVLKQTIFYIEGYFVSEKIDVCRYIFKTFCQDTENILVTNLSATYILETFAEDMKFLVENAHLVFGNRKEFQTLAQMYMFESINQLAQHLLSHFDKEKVLIMTNGDKDVVLYNGSNAVFKKLVFKVPAVPIAAIVDTTGAGDSFVAGFLFKYVRKKSLAECVEYGIAISNRVIKAIGCNLPESD